MILHSQYVNSSGSSEGGYYLYGYDGNQVVEVGTCNNLNGREGTYYSAKQNAFVIISTGTSSSMDYQYYKITDNALITDIGLQRWTNEEPGDDGYIYYHDIVQTDGTAEDITEDEFMVFRFSHFFNSPG